MSQTLYYIAPPQRAFDEMKAACIAVWNTYDDTHGYASEKIGAIQDIENISDNFMYMMAMFDENNRAKVLDSISSFTRDEFDARMS